MVRHAIDIDHHFCTNNTRLLKIFLEIRNLQQSYHLTSGDIWALRICGQHKGYKLARDEKYIPKYSEKNFQQNLTLIFKFELTEYGTSYPQGEKLGRVTRIRIPGIYW